MRLTKDVVKQLLLDNDGFTASSSYTSRNLQQDCYYRIKDGNLLMRRVGKTSWADSRFDTEDICDIDQTRRFLRKYIV